MDRDIIEKFANYTVQPGEMSADEYIAEMAQELLRVHTELEKTKERAAELARLLVAAEMPVFAEGVLRIFRWD